MRKAALYTTGTIFAASTIFHIVRLAVDLEIAAGGVPVPMRGSYPGLAAAAPLAGWMFMAARRS